VNQAQGQAGVDSGRLAWLIASTVVVSVLQRAVAEQGSAWFLLKGGTYLQHRLNWEGRSTRDVDGLVRGDLGAHIAALDRTLSQPWGALPGTLSFGESAAEGMGDDDAALGFHNAATRVAWGGMLRGRGG
jgi:hypothetical protein